MNSQRQTLLTHSSPAPLGQHGDQVGARGSPTAAPSQAQHGLVLAPSVPMEGARTATQPGAQLGLSGVGPVNALIASQAKRRRNLVQPSSKLQQLDDGMLRLAPRSGVPPSASDALHPESNKQVFALCVGESIDIRSLEVFMNDSQNGSVEIPEVETMKPHRVPVRRSALSRLARWVASLVRTMVLVEPYKQPSSQTSSPGVHAAAPNGSVAKSRLSYKEFKQDLGVSSAICIEQEVTHMKILGDSDLFVFAFGCIVAWDCDEKRAHFIAQRILPFVIRPYTPFRGDRISYSAFRTEHWGTDSVETGGAGGGSSDDAQFPMSPRHQFRAESLASIPNHTASPMVIIDSAAPPATAVQVGEPIVKDRIKLTSNNLYESLAYSYSLAQSVKLDFFETAVADSIEATEEVPKKLARDGQIGMSNTMVTRKMGELFLQRANVNLHSDILDTPELFWEFDEFERIYLRCRAYLDIDKRIDILNQRLDIVKDLYEILQSELNAKHGANLELIVIFLIVIEIVLQLAAMGVAYVTGAESSPLI